MLSGEARLEGCPSWCFDVYWPRRQFTEELDVLIAGCGTAQAAIYAASLPRSRIVAIDVNTDSLAHSTALCRRLHNVTHRQMGLEDASGLGQFDLVICTGVLHHLQEPATGLAALRGAVRLEGSLNLMLYKKYDRAGVYAMQEMVRCIGVTAANSTDADLEAIRVLARSLPPNHTLAIRPNMAANMATRGGASDLFLNPRDRAFTVPEVYELLARSGLALQEWHARAHYEPACLGMKGPLAERAEQLPVAERYAVGELFSMRIQRHRFVACRDDRPPHTCSFDLDAPGWQNLIPIRHRSARLDRSDPPPGRSPWVILEHYRQDGTRINFSPDEAELLERIDGERTIAEIHQGAVADADAPARRAFWRQLHRYDLAWFRTAPAH
jgi:SAM-dependent methyltransferase